MKVPEASCYPRVLFSELYGATFHRGQMGKEQEGKGGMGGGPDFSNAGRFLAAQTEQKAAPVVAPLLGIWSEKKYLIYPDRICLLH